MSALQIIKKKNKLLGIIIKNSYTYDGVDFITPNEYSQQIAYMHHPKGKMIESHIHNRHKNQLLIFLF